MKSKNGHSFFDAAKMRPDLIWALTWMGGVLALVLWDALFLNAPAFSLLVSAFLHSLFAGIVTVVLALLLGWAVGTGLFFLEKPGRRVVHLLLTFFLNIIRSVPQILGMLGGYVVLTMLIHQETLVGPSAQLLWMAGVTSLFLFLEVSDLVSERIRYYRALDFFPAMLCCGIKPGRIVNVEILWKNSASHLIHKSIALFGTALFLQCSIDFIISVGLSREVSLSNFPVTLGGLLARLDSKQDILALGKALTDFSYIPELLFRHLQGLSTAFTIVFSLVCAYRVANAYVRRKGL